MQKENEKYLELKNKYTRQCKYYEQSEDKCECLDEMDTSVENYKRPTLIYEQKT